MTIIPANLTLIREDFQNPRSLSAIKASMLAAPTDYVMVVGKEDDVVIPGTLVAGVHFLATHITTRRAYRHSLPVLLYDPLLWVQANYAGFPILHKSLISLFPEVSVEPWHTVMVRAHIQGAPISLVPGSHTIVEPWPRPERSGAYAPYRHSFSAAATMEALPTILCEEVNQEPVYSLRHPSNESTRVFCRDCSDEFLDSLVAPNVTIEIVPAFDFNLIKTSNSNLVAWFDGITDAVGTKTLSQLQLTLEFPTVDVASPLVEYDFSPDTYHRPAFSVMAITRGFDPTAWMSHTRKLNDTAPVSGCINSQAILGKIP